MKASEGGGGGEDAPLEGGLTRHTSGRPWKGGSHPWGVFVPIPCWKHWATPLGCLLLLVAESSKT